MTPTDDAFSAAVSASVATIERRTDAEVVVVAAARSGSYADVAARGASAVALVVAAVLFAVPTRFGEVGFLADVVGTWFLAERALRAPWAVRRLTGERRRRAQVEAAAAQAFHEEAVHATPNRTGLLVYLSLAEGRVALVADAGVEAVVPRGELLGCVAGVDRHDPVTLIATLDALGDVLAARLPHRPDSDATDLPDAPRIRG